MGHFMKRIFLKPVLYSLLIAGAVSYFLSPGVVYAQDLIPAEDGNFYYRVGGGQDFPMPPTLGSQSVNLNVDHNLGFGYNCGSFSPTVSLSNTLNDVKGSFENIDSNLVSLATSAISQFAMYELARNDPNAYNILNNNLIGAHNLFSMSMKSCETMQSETAKGQNPFTDWVTVSMGDSWKSKMADAASNPNDTNKADANLAKQQVEQDNGNSGVAWIGGQNAGGISQPPINVINDTTIAGYNTLLGNRTLNDTSPPGKNTNNEHLVDTWPDPKTAANWIVNVVGDESITTCSGCAKSSTPGLGLLPANQTLATQITTNLQQLVSGQQSLNEDNLAAVSAPGVMVNTEVIRALQNMSPNQQVIMVGKVGQDVATAKIVDEALLAKQILESGSRVPAIYANQAAQKSIQRAINALNQDMQNLSFDVDMRHKVVTSTMADILQNQQAQVARTQATPLMPNNAPPLMQDGAVMSTKPAQSKR